MEVSQNGLPVQWWQVGYGSGSDPMIDFGTGGWPVPLISGSTGSSVLQWNSTSLKSVRHYSPTIAEDLSADGNIYQSLPSATSGRTYLAWAGAADVQDAASDRVYQEYRIFYTDATNGNVTSTSPSAGTVYSIEHDPLTAKRNPSMSIYQDYPSNIHRMWMFWQAGDKGRWSINYSTSDSAGHNIASWVDDAQLRTPDMLASVSSPNAIHRWLWSDKSGTTTSYQNAKSLMDVVYGGITKLGQNSNILLSRYMGLTQTDITNRNYRRMICPAAWRSLFRGYIDR